MAKKSIKAQLLEAVRDEKDAVVRAAKIQHEVAPDCSSISLRMALKHLKEAEAELFRFINKE